MRGSEYLIFDPGNGTINQTIATSVLQIDEARGLIRGEHHSTGTFFFLIMTTDKENKTLLVRNNDCEILENDLNIIDVPLSQCLLLEHTPTPEGAQRISSSSMAQP